MEVFPAAVSAAMQEAISLVPKPYMFHRLQYKIRTVGPGLFIM